MRLSVVMLACSTLLAAQAPPVPDLKAIGPRVGTAAPAFTGTDQFGRSHTLQSLLARDGLMLVFFRSADW